MTPLAKQPLMIDLYAGLGGWASGGLAEGYRVVGFDNERHVYGEAKYPAQLVIQDVLTLHGSQLKDAALIVASPPCQFFSYCAMPWSRAKQLAADVRADPIRLEKELALFNACFRIQREASEAAGRHIPLIVENVRGAQPWVGRADWNFGSFYLWGDVPALMPIAFALKGAGYNMNKGTDKKWNTHESDFSSNAAGIQVGIKQPGISGLRTNGKGDRWFQDGAAKSGSKSNARKAASAAIAKIPFVLAQHIARMWKPELLSLEA